MNKEKHLELKKIDIKCITCENVVKTYSTTDNIRVDICSNCHPFYTKQTSIWSKKGRVDKFNKKFNKVEKLAKK